MTRFYTGLMLTRDPASHKGENGKVLIIGGSAAMHGAPIFSLLAAEAAGADLLFLSLPAVHAEAAKSRCLNVQLRPFEREEISTDDVDMLLELMATVDCAVIGPGLGREPPQLKAIASLLSSASCPLVIDASALQQETLEHVRGKPCVLTPHDGELERMGLTPEGAAGAAKEYGVTIHRKGMTDRITSRAGKTTEVAGGDAGLTVGGTGDALAGLIGGLIARGMEHATACETASRTIKTAGEVLGRTQATYRTEDVIRLLPTLLLDKRAPEKPYKPGTLIA